MQALPEHKYMRIGDDNKIIPLILKRDQYGKPGPTAYRDLNKILTEEFPGAMAGHLKEKDPWKSSQEKEVIVFENEMDCTAFLLRYGNVYGKMV